MTASAFDSKRYFVSGMKQLAPLSTMKSASSVTIDIINPSNRPESMTPLSSSSILRVLNAS
jgi:hypothetical protein